MKVKAAPGLRVPMQGQPRKYIEQQEVEVPETAYYLLRITEGDLIRTDTSGTAAAPISVAPAVINTAQPAAIQDKPAQA